MNNEKKIGLTIENKSSESFNVDAMHENIFVTVTVETT